MAQDSKTGLPPPADCPQSGLGSEKEEELLQLEGGEQGAAGDVVVVGADAGVEDFQTHRQAEILGWWGPQSAESHLLSAPLFLLPFSVARGPGAEEPPWSRG